MQLAVTDLFVVGLGFDFVGAWLLARGLIATPDVIVQRHASYWASNAPAAFAAAEDRVDGRFGVASLLVGFALQAAGYVLDLAGVGDRPADSAARTTTALVLLLAGVLLAIATWRLSRKRLLRGLLVDMAYWKPTGAGEPATRQARADSTVLSAWAGNMGHPRREGEDDWAYAKRVFGLGDDDVIEPARP